MMLYFALLALVITLPEVTSVCPNLTNTNGIMTGKWLNEAYSCFNRLHYSDDEGSDDDDNDNNDDGDWIPAEAAGEFSSPELTLCPDSYSVSVPPPCYRVGT